MQKNLEELKKLGPKERLEKLKELEEKRRLEAKELKRKQEENIQEMEEAQKLMDESLTEIIMQEEEFASTREEKPKYEQPEREEESLRHVARYGRAEERGEEPAAGLYQGGQKNVYDIAQNLSSQQTLSRLEQLSQKAGEWSDEDARIYNDFKRDLIALQKYESKLPAPFEQVIDAAREAMEKFGYKRDISKR